MRKYFFAVLCFCLILPMAIMLSACGKSNSSSNNNDNNKIDSNATFERVDSFLLGTNSSFSKFYKDGKLVFTSEDEYQNKLFNAANDGGISSTTDFLIKARFSDGSIKTIRYTPRITRGEGSNMFTIEFIYNGEVIYTIYGEIKEPLKQLPDYTFNVTMQYNTSYGDHMVLNEPLVYTGNEKDLTEIIKLTHYEGEKEYVDTLSTLVRDGKIEIDDATPYQFTNSDWNGQKYEEKFIRFSPAQGYCWAKVHEDDPDDTSHKTIFWSIKRKVVEQPTLATNNYTYSFTYDSTSGFSPQSPTLVINYNGVDSNIFNVQIKQNGSAVTSPTDAGTYSLSVTLNNDNYCMLEANNEVSTAELDDFTISPYKLSIDGIVFTPPENQSPPEYNGENIPCYSYTSRAFVPGVNIIDENGEKYPYIFKLDSSSYTEVNSNGEPYTYRISVNQNLANYIENENTYAKNFVWNNDNPILLDAVYEYKFFIVQAESAELPNGFSASSVLLKDIEYNGNLTYELNFGNGESSFTDETIGYLTNLNMFTNKGPNGVSFAIKGQANNEVAFTNDDYSPEDGVWEKTITLLWYKENPANVAPAEFYVTVTMKPKTIEVNPNNINEVNPNDINNSNSAWIQDNAYKYTLNYQFDNNSTLNDKILGCFTYSIEFFNNSAWQTASNTDTAGTYRTVATWGASSDNNKYFKLIDATSTQEVISSLYKEWEIGKVNLELYTYDNNWKTTYQNSEYASLNSYGALPSGAVQSFSGFQLLKDNSWQTVDNYFDLSATTYKIYQLIVENNTDSWVETTSTSLVGIYKTVATLSFKSGLKHANFNVTHSEENAYIDSRTNELCICNNSVSSNGEVVTVGKIWYVYPSAIELQTYDKNQDNYIGYEKSDYTHDFDGNEYEPEILAPSYIRTYNTFGIGATQNGNSWTSSSWTTVAQSAQGDYLASPTYGVFTSFIGWENVTISVLTQENGTPTNLTDYLEKTGDYLGRFLYNNENVHFAIVEANPVDIMVGEENSLVLNQALNFFRVEITTGGDYVLYVANTAFGSSKSSGEVVQYKLESENEYNVGSFPRSSLNGDMSYYIVPLHEIGTYILKIDTKVADNLKNDEHLVGLIAYDTSVDFELQNDHFVVSRINVANKSSVVTVPQEIAVSSEANINTFNVTHIASNAFVDDALTEIYLPSTISYIGANAFANCVNLTTIYFDGNISTWEQIDISQTTFDGCSSGLIIRCSDGSVSPYANAPNEIVTVSFNPEVEFIFSNSGALLNVTALDEYNLTLDDFMGKTKEEAIKLFIDKIQALGYFDLESSGTLYINLSNSLNSIELNQAIDNYLVTQELNSITASVDEIDSNYLDNLISTLFPNKTSGEIGDMSVNEKMRIIASARGEVVSLTSQDLKDLYYLMRGSYLSLEKAETLLSAIENISELSTEYRNLSYALSSFESTYNSFVEDYSSNYIGQTSKLYLAKKAWANLKSVALSGNSYDSLGAELDAAQTSMNDIIDEKNSAVDAFKSALINFVTTINTTLSNAQTYLDFTFDEDSALSGFYNAFITNYANDDLSIWASSQIIIVNFDDTSNTYSYQEQIGSMTIKYNFQIVDGANICYISRYDSIPGQTYETASWIVENNQITLLTSPNILFNIGENNVLTKIENTQTETYLVPENISWLANIGAGSDVFTIAFCYVDTGLGNSDQYFYVLNGNYTSGNVVNQSAFQRGKWSMTSAEPITLEANINGATLGFEFDNSTLTQLVIPGESSHTYLNSGITYSLNDNGCVYGVSGDNYVDFGTWSIDSSNNITINTLKLNTSVNASNL